MEKKNNEKKCLACKRTLLTESKTGLCPECLNKYGSPAAALVATVGVGVLVKFGPKILKVLLKK